MTVALEPQDAAGLASFATAVSTPGSASFRDYLSVSQFAARFGATAAHIAAVRAALLAEGLNVGAVTANNLTIPITGTAAQVQQAFSLSLSQVKLSSGRTAFTNVQAPALPAGIAPYVQGVVGLSDVTPDQPAGLIKPSGRSPLTAPASRPQFPTGGPQPCSSATAEQAMGGLTADEIATAYQFSGLYGAGDLGAGQTVALFEEQPYNPTDIATYQACYGTGAPISNVDVDGGPGPYQPPTSGGSGDGESALDIEQVIGLAPKANILVYEGPFTSTVNIISAIVSQDRAKVISSSYGVCEALTGGTVINAENTLLQEAAAQGQSFYISSGDSGSSMCFQADQNNTGLSVIDPGGQPFATGVGGTTLFSGTDQNPNLYQPGVPGFDIPVQSVWNDGFVNNRASGSGGGISSSFTMPSYQSGAAATLGVLRNASTSPCGGPSFCREVPDVAADADPNTGYAVFSDGMWGVTGGTSAAAPLWAAFTSLADASATCRGLSIGFANPSLYQTASTSYLNNFSDVSQASPENPSAPNNDALGINNGLYPVGTGYDMATGLGSMIAPALASSLCGLRSPAYTVSVANPGNPVSVAGHGVALQIHATDSGGAALGYAASGLPAGLSINAASGLVSGVPTTAGTSTVTVSAGDGFTNGGSTAFSWTVIKPGPPTSHGSLGGIARRKAKLVFTVGAGSFAPAIKSIVVSLPSGLSFAKSSKSLKKGIVIRRANGKKLKFKASVKGGRLTITLGSAVGKASITIATPAITVSSSLARKVKRGKIKKLSIGLKAIDTSHKSTGLTLRLKV